MRTFAKIMGATVIILYGQALAFGQAAGRPVSAVPNLDELASDWIEVRDLRNFPSVMNFVGGLQTTENITGFQNMTFPPYAQGREKQFSWEYGLNSIDLPDDQKEQGDCQLLVNGQLLAAAFSKWRPYEVERKASVNGIELRSFIRLPFEQKGVLQRLVLNNRSANYRSLTITLDCLGRVRAYPKDQWRTWDNSRPTDSAFGVNLDQSRKTLIVQDQRSGAVTAYSFGKMPGEMQVANNRGMVNWKIDLAAGQKIVIDWVCVIGDATDRVVAQSAEAASHFDSRFREAKTKWEQRWQASFVTGNGEFSGHFPTFVTNDTKLRRVYYEGALVPLLLCRTDLSLSSRCFVTAGPQWANSLVYFWDTEMWANTWAMLEPVAMKEQLKKWLSMDFHHCYAVDCLSGGGAGPWYAANDWSVFRTVEAYLGVTGDSSFLQEAVGDRTVLEHLDAIATWYQTRPLIAGGQLANYGGPANLLECSPSYIQGVPSLNAANVYMLRKVAEYQARSGNGTRAAELRADAARLLPEVLSLYVPGVGVWDALDTAGHKVPIRHCYDYITIGQALEKDLSPRVRSEMNHFVESELLTRTWMRAMSLKDPAAAKSDRPDHGPMGSYDAWSPMTMDVLCRLGDFRRALSFLHATETITHLGSWSQAHEFVGPDSRGFDPVVRVASRGGQDANEGCGAAFAEVIMRAFFGFRPDLSGDKPVLLSPDVPRGFKGMLKHISWKQQLYTIVSDDKGVHIFKEK